MGKYSKDNLKCYEDFAKLAKILIRQYAKNYKNIITKLYTEDIIDAIGTAFITFDEDKASFSTFVVKSVKWKIMTIINKHKRVVGKLDMNNRCEIHPNISFSLNKSTDRVDIEDTVDYIRKNLSPKEYKLFYAKYAENTSDTKLSERFGYNKAWIKKELERIMIKVRSLKICE